MNKYLDFENDIENIEKLITNLDISKNNFRSEKVKLLDKKNKILDKIYSNLSAWQKVQVARHPNRPHTKDYINLIFENIIYLHGDKKFSDDSAVLGCLGEISGQSVIVIGTEKGNSMESRIKHNFGMAKPEGYRKAQRLMNIADKYNLPIITFVDTAGAFPGKDAEERGQSESIASSIQTSLKIGPPIISIVIGEGGSGGAIALATADKVLMLEHSIYSVISPEGCASILWRSSDYIQKAAASLKLTAKDCLNNKIIDSIVKEVAGGAHRFPEDQADVLKNEIRNSIEALKLLSIEERRNQRNQKFLNMTAEI
jgi:acetyl-CoA carboxylase carboxyl transferase subunit alpha